MNSAPLSCLGLALAFVSTAMAQRGEWLWGEPTAQANLVAELTSGPAAPVAAGRAGKPGSGSGQPIRRAEDGMFYVEALVNGAAVRFLVDTGASHTVLTRADAVRVGVHADRTRDVVTATGPARFGWATLDRLSLAGQNVPGAIAAISNERLPVSLLGQDMLSRFTVTIAGDRLWLA